MFPFAPYWLVTMVFGALVTMTVFLYLPEIRAFFRWLVSGKDRRNKAIAYHFYNIQQEELTKAMADSILKQATYRAKEIEKLLEKKFDDDD